MILNTLHMLHLTRLNFILINLSLLLLRWFCVMSRYISLVYTPFRVCASCLTIRYFFLGIQNGSYTITFLYSCKIFFFRTSNMLFLLHHHALISPFSRTFLKSLSSLFILLPYPSFLCLKFFKIFLPWITLVSTWVTL